MPVCELSDKSTVQNTTQQADIAQTTSRPSSNAASPQPTTVAFIQIGKTQFFSLFLGCRTRVLPTNTNDNDDGVSADIKELTRFCPDIHIYLPFDKGVQVESVLF